MAMQFGRLNVGNDWLSSPEKALNALFQSMGAPEPFPTEVFWGSVILWIAIAAALLFLVGLPLVRAARRAAPNPSDWALLSGAGWVLAALWLWDQKPEVWFVYYSHVAIWVFLGFLALWLAEKDWRRYALGALAGTSAATALLFLYVSGTQWSRLAADPTWRWNSYEALVDCVDARVSELLATRPKDSRPPQVWCPTFPDITIELSRRHPDWDLTRTNDFWSRNALALEHGKQVDAMVVTEIWGDRNRVFSGSALQYPTVQSVWMNWQGYYLSQFMKFPGWMPNRYVCGVYRWQGFIFSR
jgi:hypothetical protein